MKREILFRGKSLKTGEWIEGQRHTYGDGVYICQTELMSNGGKDFRVPDIEVDPESVGQFIFKTVRDERIFEGDVCLFDVLAVDEQPAINNLIGEVTFGGIGWARMAYCTNIKKIGNIFDNPELLKKSSHHLQM